MADMAETPTPPERDNESRKEQFLLRLKSGSDTEVSATSLGIESWELDEWLADDAFNARVKQAGAQCEANLVGMIYAAASNGSVGAAMWLLERGFKGRWSRPTAAMKNGALAASDVPTDSFAALDNVTELDSRRR